MFVPASCSFIAKWGMMLICIIYMIYAPIIIILLYSLDNYYLFAGGTWYTTYTSVPHYITSHSRSLMLESLEPIVFDMTDPTTISIELDSNVMVGRIISGQ